MSDESSTSETVRWRLPKRILALFFSLFLFSGLIFLRDPLIESSIRYFFPELHTFFSWSKFSTSLYPITIQVDGIKIQKYQGVSGDVSRLQVQLLKLSSPLKLSLEIDRPNIQYKPDEAQKASTPKSEQPPISPLLGSISVKVTEGSLVLPKVTLRKVNSNHILSSTNSRLEGNLSAALDLSLGTQVSLPVSADVTANLKGDLLSLEKLNFSLAGLSGKIEGTFDQKSLKSQLNAEIMLSDLTKIPLSAEQLKGLFLSKVPQGGIRITGALSGDASQGHLIRGQFISEGLALPIDWRNEKNDRIDGQASLSGTLPFLVLLGERLSKVVSVETNSASLNINLSDLNIIFPTKFEKVKGTKLQANLSLEGTGEKIKIIDSKILLHSIILSIIGELPVKEDGHVALSFGLNVNGSNGLAKIFPSLGIEDINCEKCSLGLAGRVSGQRKTLSDLKGQTSFSIERFKATGIPVPLSLVKNSLGPEWNLSGAALPNLEGRLAWSKGQLLDAWLMGDLNLRASAISYSTSLKKGLGRPLTIAFDVSGKQSQLSIKRLDVSGQGYNLSTAGIVGILNDGYQLNLSSLINLDLLGSSEMFSAISTYGLAGLAKSKLKVTGKYDSKLGPLNSPLFLEGEISANVKNLELPKPIQDTNPPSPNTPFSKTPNPYLNSKLLTNANISIDTTFDQMKALGHKASGIKANGSINRGQLSGSLKMEQVLGGTLERLEVSSKNLASITPLSGSAKFDGLSLSSIPEFSSSDYGKTFNSLKTSGDVAFSLNDLDNFLGTAQIKQLILYDIDLISRTVGRIDRPASEDFVFKLTSECSLKSFSKIETLITNPILKGLEGNGNLRLLAAGKYSKSQGLQGSPFTLVGDAKVDLAKLSLPSLLTEQNEKKTEPNQPQPTLPNWPIITGSTFKITANVGHVDSGEIRLGNVSALLNYNLGQANLSGNIGKLFGGKLVVDNMNANLITASSPLSAAMRMDGIEAKEATALLSKKYAEQIAGKISGNIKLDIPDRSVDSLIAVLTASGSITAKEGWLSTASIDEMINEKIFKILSTFDKFTGFKTAEKNKKVTSDGLRGDADLSFAYTKGTLDLKSFRGISKSNNEFNGKGICGIDFQCDLNGTASWATLSVPPAVLEANNDGKGRLTFPLRYHGNVFSPSIDVATDPILRMAKKTAENEAKKAVKKATNEAVEKGTKALLKKIFKK